MHLLKRNRSFVIVASLFSGVAATILLGSGCAKRATSFEIVNYRGPGVVEALRESFPEACYDLDAQGNIEVVLRTESSGEGVSEHRIVQLVHLKTFWQSIPGRTIADRTQLNATVAYYVISPAVVAGYEGAGSLFASRNQRTGELIGALELARLTPSKVVMGNDPVFERSELKGTFRATHDPRRVTTLVNELERVFGPK